MDFKIGDNVKFINLQNDNEEVGEIQLIAKVTECCTTGIVGKDVYYVRATTGGQLCFKQNLERCVE